MEHQEHVVIDETRTVETHATPHTEKVTYRDQVARAVAVIGLIAILLLGAWGIIQIAFNLPNVLSGIGGYFAAKPKPEAIALVVPQTAVTGEAFTVSWTHANKGSGNYMYSVSYSCVDGLSIKAPAPNGSLQATTCATPFNYTNATQSMQLTPTVKGKSQLTTTVTVSAIALETGAITATKTGTVTILPERSKTTPAVRPTTTSSATTRTQSTSEGTAWGTLANSGATTISENTRYSNPVGQPDLSVSIVTVVPLSNNLYSVRFMVENVGTKVSPSGWTFAARLPVGYDYSYYSQPQQALYPGDKIMYSLTFSGAPSYNGNGNCYNTQYYPNNYQPNYYNTNYNNTNANYYQYSIQYPYQQSNCYSVDNNGGGSNTVTIMIDPQNTLSEISRGNNSATAGVPIGY